MKRKHQLLTIPCKDGDRRLMSMIQFFYGLPGVLSVENWEDQEAIIPILTQTDAVHEDPRSVYIPLFSSKQSDGAGDLISAAVDAECEVISYALLQPNVSTTDYVQAISSSIFPHKSAISNEVCSLVANYVVNGTDLFISFDATMYTKQQLMDICK